MKDRDHRRFPSRQREEAAKRKVPKSAVRWSASAPARLRVGRASLSLEKVSTGVAGQRPSICGSREPFTALTLQAQREEMTETAQRPRHARALRCRPVIADPSWRRGILKDVAGLPTRSCSWHRTSTAVRHERMQVDQPAAHEARRRVRVFDSYDSH